MNWKKELEKKFLINLVDKPKVEGMSTSVYPGVKCHIDDMEAFISTLLEKQKEEMIERIKTRLTTVEGGKLILNDTLKNFQGTQISGIEIDRLVRVYRQALDDILSALKGKE